jgi:hypothetical protein
VNHQIFECKLRFLDKARKAQRGMLSPQLDRFFFERKKQVGCLASSLPIVNKIEDKNVHLLLPLSKKLTDYKQTENTGVGRSMRFRTNVEPKKVLIRP